DAERHCFGGHLQLGGSLRGDGRDTETAERDRSQEAEEYPLKGTACVADRSEMEGRHRVAGKESGERTRGNNIAAPSRSHHGLCNMMLLSGLPVTARSRQDRWMTLHAGALH